MGGWGRRVALAALILFSYCLCCLVNETPVVVKPYKFKMAEVEGFRYRINVRHCSYTYILYICM